MWAAESKLLTHGHKLLDFKIFENLLDHMALETTLEEVLPTEENTAKKLNGELKRLRSGSNDDLDESVSSKHTIGPESNKVTLVNVDDKATQCSSDDFVVSSKEKKKNFQSSSKGERKIKESKKKSTSTKKK